jgi:CRP/FNR family transcriptional regulator, cyclic AMP receptor protein
MAETGSVRFETLRELAALSQDQLDLLLESLETVSRPAGAPIVPEDDTDTVYLVLAGIVRVTAHTHGGERTLYDLLGPGDVLAYPSLLPQLRCDLRCEASTSCTLGRIRAERLVDRVISGMRYPDFRMAARLMVGSWWSMLARRAYLLGQSLPERVIFTLNVLARKIGTPHPRGVLLNVALTHQELAALVCASRPKVSALLKRFERNGALLRVGRGFVVVAAKFALAASPREATPHSRNTTNLVAIPTRSKKTIAKRPKPKVISGRKAISGPKASRRSGTLNDLASSGPQADGGPSV